MKKKSLFILIVILAGVACRKKPEVVEIPSLKVDKTSLQLTPVSGTESGLKLESNVNWKITVLTANADWLQLSQTEGFGNALVKIIVAKENTGLSRMAEILIAPASGNAVSTIKVIVEQKPYKVEEVWNRSVIGNSDDVINAVTPTADGGYLLAGYTFSNKGGDIGYASKGDVDFLIIKLNANRDTLWTRTLGGSSSEVATSVVKSADGAYVIAGYTSSNKSGDVGETKGSYDGWLVKMKDNGDTVWTRTVGDMSTQTFSAIAGTPDGGFLLTGSTYTGTATGDVYIVKLNSLGDLIWSKQIGGLASDRACGIALATDGGFVITGASRSSSGDVPVNKGNQDIWVVKLNSAGNTEPSVTWSKTFGGNEDDLGFGVLATADGGYVISGYTESSQNGDITALNFGKADFWVLKLNDKGEKVWDKNFGGSGNDVAYAIVQTAGGSFILGGYTESDANGDVDPNHGISDFWLVKVNSLGHKLWQKTFGTINREDGKAIATATDGTFIIAGSTSSPAIGVNGYVVKAKEY